MCHGLFLLTVATIFQTGGTRESPGPLFTSKVGGFSIAMPSAPTDSNKTQQVSEGTLVHKIYLAPGRTGVFSVICTDYPTTIKVVDLQPFLNGIIQGYIKPPGSKILSQQKLVFDGTAARDVAIDNKGRIMRARCFIRDRRIYQIAMMSEAPLNVVNPEFDKFVATFRSFPPVGKLTDPSETTSAWKPYRSKEGGFTILMIGEPIEQTQVLETALGHFESKITHCFDARGENFGVSYSPVAPSVSALTPDQFYSAVVKSAAAKMNGKVLTQRPVETEGRHGTEALIELAGDKSGTAKVSILRMYWINDRIYKLIYTGPAGNVENKEVSAFFGSFKFDGSLARPATPRSPRVQAKSSTNS